MSVDFSNDKRTNDSIALQQKESHLRSFSVEQLREECVIPLFERAGLVHAGTYSLSNGSHADVFHDTGPLNDKILHLVLCNVGRLSRAESNEIAVDGVIQRVSEATEKATNQCNVEKRIPGRLYLASNNTVNEKVKKLVAKVSLSFNLEVIDSEKLIDLFDGSYPEFWEGIKAGWFPYLTGLIKYLDNLSDMLLTVDEENGVVSAPHSDGSYIPLYLNRIKREVKKAFGRYQDKPVFLEVSDEALLRQREKRILVTGEAGSGKSTVLRRIAYQLCKEGLSLSSKTHKTPVLLRAPELSRSDLIDIVGASRDFASKISQARIECISLSDFASGDVVVLVDAIDEVPDSKKDLILSAIQSFTEAFPSCLLIVTSRESSLVEKFALQNRFAHYRVSPISIKQASQIIDRVLEIGKRKDQAKATEVLRRIQDMHGVQLNPFLVTIFAITSESSKQDIPPNITELFKKYTEQMLGRWDRRKGMAHLHEAPLKDHLLARIAFKLHRAKQTSLSVGEMKEAVFFAMKETGKESSADAIYDEIVFRSGLLVVEEERVRFRHLLLQEFFAGRGAGSHVDFSDVLHDNWWTNPVMFYFGDDPKLHQNVHFLTSMYKGGSWAADFNAAVTVGLASQAAYFSRVEDRKESVKWVIRLLSSATETFLMEEVDQARHPIMEFIARYVVGRDAVASSVIEEVYEEIKSTSPNDYVRFWATVGLVEAGFLEKAISEIRDFFPNDSRLLLGLHLSAYMIAHLKVTTPKEKKLARELLEILNPRTRGLASAVMQEFQGMLLEMRQGEITVIDAPVSTPSGQYELSLTS